jgi:CRP-like cAMP-binding protein
MSDPSPPVLRRLLTLRHVRELAGATLPELAALAENLDEVVLPAGAAVGTAGHRQPALYIVVDGRLEAAGGARWGRNRMFGAVEVLADRAPAEDVRAAVATTALRLDGNACVELLEDNFGTLVLVLRDLARRLAPFTGGRRAAHVAPPASPDPLDMVQRLIVLRGQLPFAAGRLQALATLAQLSEEVRRPAGTVIVRAGALADAVLVLLEGTVAVRGDDGTTTIRAAGDAIGGLETLAGGRHTSTVEAVTATRALVSRGDAVLDVIEDHTDLGLAMIEAIAGGLLDAGAAWTAPD